MASKLAKSQSALDYLLDGTPNPHKGVNGLGFTTDSEAKDASVPNTRDENVMFNSVRVEKVETGVTVFGSVPVHYLETSAELIPT
ncbi:hypothetical protein RYX45_22515, partial [Alkalihalophilus pseudofirmus]